MGERIGGGGKNFHCWALLDRGNENRDRKNIWLDKNNLNLCCQMPDFNENETVNKSGWTEFVKNW